MKRTYIFFMTLLQHLFIHAQLTYGNGNEVVTLTPDSTQQCFVLVNDERKLMQTNVSATNGKDFIFMRKKKHTKEFGRYRNIYYFCNRIILGITKYSLKLTTK